MNSCSFFTNGGYLLQKNDELLLIGEKYCFTLEWAGM